MVNSTFCIDFRIVRSSHHIHPARVYSLKWNTHSSYLPLYFHTRHALDRDFDWWATTFQTAIGEIGHTLVFMIPWNGPIPLTRAWCLWELHCTRATGSKLEILLSPRQAKDFYHTIITDSHKIFQSLRDIDVKKASAYLAADRENIFRAVDSSPGGAAAVNDEITDFMR